MPQPVVQPLKKTHDRTAFCCGNEVLDRYLREQTSQDMKKRVATPFGLIEPPGEIVMAYYTLSAGSVQLDHWPKDLKKKLPRYELIPVTLLGRLALDKNHQGRGLGQFLLMDALFRVARTACDIASVAVIVDAIDDPARDFYKHFGFIVFPNQTHRLFLPLKTIENIF